MKVTFYATFCVWPPDYRDSSRLPGLHCGSEAYSGVENQYNVRGVKTSRACTHPGVPETGDRVWYRAVAEVNPVFAIETDRCSLQGSVSIFIAVIANTGNTTENPHRNPRRAI